MADFEIPRQITIRCPWFGQLFIALLAVLCLCSALYFANTAIGSWHSIQEGLQEMHASGWRDLPWGLMVLWSVVMVAPQLLFWPLSVISLATSLVMVVCFFRNSFRVQLVEINDGDITIPLVESLLSPKGWKKTQIPYSEIDLAEVTERRALFVTVFNLHIRTADRSYFLPKFWFESNEIFFSLRDYLIGKATASSEVVD